MTSEESTGMLWCDTEGTLGQRLSRAVEYYREKYGEPTWVRVSVKDWTDYEKELGDWVSPLGIEPLETVLPFHIWIGEEE